MTYEKVIRVAVLLDYKGFTEYFTDCRQTNGGWVIDKPTLVGRVRYRKEELNKIQKTALSEAHHRYSREVICYESDKDTYLDKIKSILLDDFNTRYAQMHEIAQKLKPSK